jgi:hypothetical protein
MLASFLGVLPIVEDNLIKTFFGWMPVAHVYNSSYSGGRDQEDHSLRPAWANSSRAPILKNPITKRAGGVAQGVGPEFKPQSAKKDGGTGV